MEKETDKKMEQEVATSFNGGTEQPQETEDTPPTFRKKIGNTTYIVNYAKHSLLTFSETSKQTMSDIICRMIKRDIESGNY